MKKYELLLFDADGTLFDFRSAMYQSVKHLITDLGFECTEKMLIDYNEINNEMWRRHEDGEITKAEMRTKRFEKFAKLYKIDKDPDELDSMYLFNLAHCPHLIDGAEELCKKLKEKYRMAIVTNGIAPMQRIRLKASAIADCFEKIFISDEMNVRKPQKEFFDKVFEEYPDVDKSRVLMIGDTPSIDIKGGNNAGVDTCFVNLKKRPIPNDVEITYEIENYSQLEKLLLC